jgi:hypothetical protein
MREVKYYTNDVNIDIDIEKEVKDYLSYAYENNKEPLLDIDKDEGGGYVYTFYADYQDELDDKDIAAILEDGDPELALEELLYESYDDSRGEVLDTLSENAATYIEKKYREALGNDNIELDDDENQRVYEAIEDAVSVNYDIEHYLNQNVNIDLTIDTGDGNYDYSLNCVYPAYGGSETIDPHSSLAFLAESQGYSVEDLQKELSKGDIVYPEGFLESIRQEVANEASSINRLTVLLRMPLRDAIKVNELVHKAEKTGQEFRPWERPDCGSLTIGKNATLGLFDPWNGGGSTFEIALEKDLELPVKYIRSALPDMKIHGDYSVEEVYGMCKSAWGEDLKAINEPNEPIREEEESSDLSLGSKEESSREEEDELER